MSNRLNIESVPVAGITVGKRHRALDQDKVLELATNIEEIGLLQPITVSKDVEGGVFLVAGYHRLEAVKALNWDSVDAAVIPADDCELAEIAENLIRLDLTKEQRDEHIRRYAELLKEKEANESETEIQAAQTDAPEIGYKKPPAQKKGIASKIAAETGLSKSTVNRALSEKKPKPKPSSVTEEGKTDEPKERAPNGLKELARAWLMASPEARDEFLERHDLTRKAKAKPPTIELTADKPAPAPFRDIPPEKPNTYAAAKAGEIDPKEIPDFLKKDQAA